MTWFCSPSVHRVSILSSWAHSAAKKIAKAGVFDSEKKLSAEGKVGRNMLQNRFWFQCHSLKVPTVTEGVRGLVVFAWRGVSGVPETFACNETETFQVRANEEGEIEMNRSVDMPVMTPSGDAWAAAGHFDLHGAMCEPMGTGTGGKCGGCG